MVFRRLFCAPEDIAGDVDAQTIRAAAVAAAATLHVRRLSVAVDIAARPWLRVLFIARLSANFV